jgi:hypothetical protein
MTERGAMKEGGYFHWQRWLWCNRVSVSVFCFPHHWGFHWRENGARADQVLDTALMIGPWSFELTVWDFSRLGRFIRWVPRGKNGRGHVIGWW